MSIQRGQVWQDKYEGRKLWYINDADDRYVRYQLVTKLLDVRQDMREIELDELILQMKADEFPMLYKLCNPINSK